MGKKKRKKSGARKPPRKVYQPPLSQIRSLVEKQAALLERARGMPFVGCWRHRQWQTTGMTSLLLAREQDASRVVYAVYLVDLLCLGVKDAFVRTNVSRTALGRHVQKIFDGAEEPCDIAFAHQLIYGAIDFARKYGFEPHPDFYREGADKILDPPGTHPEPYDIEFGRDGGPLYIAGPNDSPAFDQWVVETGSGQVVSDARARRRSRLYSVINHLSTM